MKQIKHFLPFTLLGLLIFASCQKRNYNLNDLPPTVKSFFTVNKTDIKISDELEFTNESQDATSYLWDFGDSTTSAELNPKKTYKNPGTYTVSLKAIGPGGTGNYSRDLTVIDPSLPTGNQGTLFFIEYTAKLINKISLVPASPVEKVLDITSKTGVGLAYDTVGKKIYFTDFTTSNGKIWRMNLDGSSLEQIVSGITDPYSIAVNMAAGKIYWADDDGNVGRSNLDGSALEREFINVPDGQMRGIAYDNKNGNIYFYEVNDEDLYIAKADGTGVSKVVSGAYGYAIYVDEKYEKLYYEDRNIPAIMQTNLDGTSPVKIADVPSTRVHGMAIDYGTNKFYWADRDKGWIKRCDLNGANPETLLSGLKSPRGLFVK